MGIPVGGFADVEATSFEALPAGRYHASVFEGEVKQAGPNAKHPGSDYIAWTFNVLEDPYVNRKLWHNTSLVDTARGMLKAFLLAFYTEDELNEEDFELNIEDLVGRECILVITKGKNPNTDEDNNSVRRVLPASDEDTDAADLPS